MAEHKIVHLPHPTEAEYKIEDNIPIPSKSNILRKYPFSEMKIGQSIAVPLGNGNSARAMASTYGARKGKKFTSRREGDIVRIWRIK